MGAPRVLKPASAREAARMAQEARLCAGGTATQVELANGVAAPAAFVDLATIPGRDFVRRESGAHLSLAALARDAQAAAFAPGLVAQR
jgi:CO/xanthine dehydrogenase FAD-binding subunit